MRLEGIFVVNTRRWEKLWVCWTCRDQLCRRERSKSSWIEQRDATRSLDLVQGRLSHHRRHHHLHHHRQGEFGRRAVLLHLIGRRRGNPDRRFVLRLLDVGRRHLLRADLRQ